MNALFFIVYIILKMFEDSSLPVFLIVRNSLSFNYSPLCVVLLDWVEVYLPEE